MNLDIVLQSLWKWWWKWKCKLVTQSCLTLCNPMDHSPPDSSVHGIFPARILEWVAMPISRRSSWARDWTRVSALQEPLGKRFTVFPTNWQWWFAGSLGLRLLLIALSLQFLLFFFTFSVWVQISSVSQDTVMLDEAHRKELTLTLSSAKIFFQNKVTFTGTGD